MLLVYLTIPNPENCSHENESTLRQAMTNQLNMHVSFYRRRERTGKGRVREWIKDCQEFIRKIKLFE